MSWQGLNLDLTGVVFDGGDFRGAEFTGGEVRFDWAQFTGGTVDFRQVAVWKMRRNSIGTTRHHRESACQSNRSPGRLMELQQPPVLLRRPGLNAVPAAWATCSAGSAGPGHAKPGGSPHGSQGLCLIRRGPPAGPAISGTMLYQGLRLGEERYSSRVNAARPVALLRGRCRSEWCPGW